jgi:hypothetical protein
MVQLKKPPTHDIQPGGFRDCVPVSFHRSMFILR